MSPSELDAFVAADTQRGSTPSNSPARGDARSDQRKSEKRGAPNHLRGHGLLMYFPGL
jgi:hypothetical protein